MDAQIIKAAGPVCHAGHRRHNCPRPVRTDHARVVILELSYNLGLIHRPFAAATGVNQS